MGRTGSSWWAQAADGSAKAAPSGLIGLEPQAPTSRSRNDGIHHSEAVDEYVNLVDQSQRYHRDDAVSSSSERNVSISPLRRRRRPSPPPPPTPHGDTRQLG